MYKDPDKQREYQRKWRAQRRQNFFKDRACSDCGTFFKLELHHVDPSLKVDHNIWTWKEQRRLAELAKCIVLCRQCHQKYSIASFRSKPRPCLTTRKLKRNDVDKIKQFESQGLTQREIGELLGIDHSTISRIRTGKLYKNW